MFRGKDTYRKGQYLRKCNIFRGDVTSVKAIVTLKVGSLSRMVYFCEHKTK